MIMVLFGLATRIVLLALSGNQPEGVLGGGSDATAYILLGEAIAKGSGMNYLGQPTALRAPLYPLMLAATKLLFGFHFLLVMRLVQVGAAMATAWICGKTAAQLCGGNAWWPAMTVAICAPTLLFFNSQILTESFAAFFVSLFLFFLAKYSVARGFKQLLGMGVCSGMLLLLRFNTLFILPIVVLAAACFPGSIGCCKRAISPVLLALLCVAPWLARNFIVFHGDIWYSSQTGTTALQGALSPDGRTQADSAFEFQKRQGWGLSDIETDRPIRFNYPSEAVLNRQAKEAAICAWSELGFRAVPLLGKKIGYFWLSTDQLFETRSFSGWQRRLRATGVFVYWTVLMGAILGWLRIRKSNPRIAYLLLVYCLFATLLHLPFTMNTRLRVPLVDPVLCVLAGIALSPVLTGRKEMTPAPTTSSPPMA